MPTVSAIPLLLWVVLGWTALRFTEFALSELNLNRLTMAGAVEACSRQHVPLLLLNFAVPPLVLLAQWLPPTVPPAWQTAAAYTAIGCEAVHWWAILTLGRRWTTGVWVLPGERPVRRGPYRWLRHPGYLFGGTASSLLPMAAGSWWLSLVVAAAMVAFVRWRIACEDRAWRELGGL